MNTEDINNTNASEQPETIIVDGTTQHPFGCTNLGRPHLIRVSVVMTTALFATMQAEAARESQGDADSEGMHAGHWAAEFLQEAMDAREERRVSARREEHRTQQREAVFARAAVLLGDVLQAQKEAPEAWSEFRDAATREAVSVAVEYLETL